MLALLLRAAPMALADPVPADGPNSATDRGALFPPHQAPALAVPSDTSCSVFSVENTPFGRTSADLQATAGCEITPTDGLEAGGILTAVESLAGEFSQGFTEVYPGGPAVVSYAATARIRCTCSSNDDVNATGLFTPVGVGSPVLFGVEKHLELRVDDGEGALKDLAATWTAKLHITPRVTSVSLQSVALLAFGRGTLFRWSNQTNQYFMLGYQGNTVGTFEVRTLAISRKGWGEVVTATKDGKAAEAERQRSEVNGLGNGL